MTNITEAQRALLTHAAAEPEGIIDAPDDEKLRRSLIKKGLAMSLPVEGGVSRLIITDAGRAAVAITTKTDEGRGQPVPEPEREPPATADAVADEGADTASDDDLAGDQPAPSEAPAPEAGQRSAGGKLGKLVELLQRSSGATLEEMVAATGWRAHSVRGAMSGSLKKKLGLTIDSAKTDGTRVYRIAVAERA